MHFEFIIVMNNILYIIHYGSIESNHIVVYDTETCVFKLNNKTVPRTERWFVVFLHQLIMCFLVV